MSNGCVRRAGGIVCDLCSAATHLARPSLNHRLYSKPGAIADACIRLIEVISPMSPWRIDLTSWLKVWIGLGDLDFRDLTPRIELLIPLSRVRLVVASEKQQL